MADESDVRDVRIINPRPGLPQNVAARGRAFYDAVAAINQKPAAEFLNQRDPRDAEIEALRREVERLKKKDK